MTGDLYRRNWASITLRDSMVLGWVSLWEHSSLKAFWYLGKNWRRHLEKRREIMRRRRASDAYMASWFDYEPMARPAPRPSARLHARVRAARS